MRYTRMHPVAYRLLSAWTAVAFIVGGVDAYNGMRCGGQTGDYMRPIPTSDSTARKTEDAVMAIPYGIGRGMLYNIGQSLDTEGRCGAASYTHQFGRGLSRTFGTPVAGKAYVLSQALFGLGGAALGGVVAEETHVFRITPP